MAIRRTGLIIVGLLLLIFGIVFALQGANFIGGSALMSGNPTWIYIGGFLAIVGLILLIMGSRSGSPKAATAAASTIATSHMTEPT